MPNNFILTETLNINNLIVKLYHTSNENIDTISVTTALSDTSSINLASQIIEKLQDINGVSKIEIYNINNELLVNSEKITS